MKNDQSTFDEAVGQIKKGCACCDVENLDFLSVDKNDFENPGKNQPVAAVLQVPSGEALSFMPSSRCFQFFWLEGMSTAYLRFDLLYAPQDGEEGVFSQIINMHDAGWVCADKREIKSALPCIF